ncbi:MAG: hypothetical protein R3C45_04770 [Phycisphaerales bacterium]
MPRFRRRPVVVVAELFDPEDDEQHTRLGLIYKAHSQYFVVPTLEGDMRVSEGDWIVTGVLGERYPCKPDAFEKTYEIVS